MSIINGRKIAILSSLAFGMQVDYEDIYTEGITKITDIDIKYAKKMGYSIKLLATSKKIDHKVFARVAPMMLGAEHPLANVHGVFNAIFVKGNVIGDVMFYGKGAGKLPTASAVVADVVDAVKHLERNIMSFWSTEKMDLMENKEVPTKIFVRLNNNKNNIKQKIEELFGNVQYIYLEDETKEIGFITDKSTEGQLIDNVNSLKEIIGNNNILNVIRIAL